MARTATNRGRALSLLLTLAVAGLVAFHGWLLLSMLATGRLLDPIVAARWIAALGLGLGLVALRRAGIPVLFGRHAAIVWILVALLHASAAEPRAEAYGSTSAADGIGLLFVLPTTAAGALLTLSLVLACRSFGRRRAAVAPALRRLWLVDRLCEAAVAPGHAPGLAPRGPPRSSHLPNFSAI